jgi:serpin B
VLTNAIYFKASWQKEFDPSGTKPREFNSDTGAREVAMMRGTFEATYSEVDGHQAVALPYASHNVTLILVLPPEGSFSDAVAKFDASIVDRLVSELKDASVTLTMPKWTFESERKLQEPLRALGMNAAFESGTADLSGMDGKHHLFVDEVYHKAFITVDEEGTEAAAATAVVVNTKSAQHSNPVTVSFDRPFLFFVYDAPTGQILFLGHVTDPS